MLKIGTFNDLRIVKQLDFGIYLDGGEAGEILMPKRYVPDNVNIDDTISAFIYKDSEDRLIATTETPKSMVGEFAFLEVVSVTTVGAFLDWGLSKDLLVPYSEQANNMEKGRKYIVYVYLDQETDRVVASSKTHKFLDNLPPTYSENDEVDVIITSKNEIGYQAIINNTHSGLLYQNEVFREIHQGQKLKAYIKKIRDDEKIDLSLHKQGFDNNMETFTKKVLDYLHNNDGVLPLTDKSNPEDIYKLLQISKRNFKQAVGNLYKQRIIKIDKDAIKIVK